MNGKIRTEATGPVESPCFACHLNGRETPATHMVLPPVEAPPRTIGLSACDADLERTQYAVTHYADDEDKIRRTLKES